MGKNTPLSEQAYEIIKEKIVTLELAPGSMIDEATLQDELEFGRTPIREALKRLALENLVTIMPRRGMFVTDIGLKDLQRLLEVRVVLEKLAVSLAADRGKPEHWRRISALLDEQETKDGMRESIIHTDEQFHEIIYEAADNPYLRNALTVMLSLNERLWYYFLPQLGEPRRSPVDHRRIFASLLAKDGEKAAKEMEEHIQSMQGRLQAILLGQEESL